MNISQKKLSHVWLISPWLPKPVLRARLKHLVKSVKKEDAALKRDGLENLREEQLKAVSEPTLKNALMFSSLLNHFSLLTMLQSTAFNKLVLIAQVL